MAGEETDCGETAKADKPLLCLPFPYRIGMWSVARRVFVLIPTSKGELRRDATHSPGKYFDFTAIAKAPST